MIWFISWTICFLATVGGIFSYLNYLIPVDCRLSSTKFELNAFGIFFRDWFALSYLRIKYIHFFFCSPVLPRVPEGPPGVHVVHSMPIVHKSWSKSNFRFFTKLYFSKAYAHSEGRGENLDIWIRVCYPITNRVIVNDSIKNQCGRFRILFIACIQLRIKNCNNSSNMIHFSHNIRPLSLITGENPIPSAEIEKKNEFIWFRHSEYWVVQCKHSSNEKTP